MPHQLFAPTPRSSTLHWWQRSVLYYIYPRSFQDSNGDGIGDVQGIITRLDYLSWLGVDCLHVDVPWLLIKDEQFRDNPINPDWKVGDLPWARQVRLYSEDRPEVHEVVRDMRAVIDSYAERVLIGEIYLSLPRLLRYYGERLQGMHFPFNFHLILLPEWNAQAIRQTVEAYEVALPVGAWPNWVLGNHDKPRLASRLGWLAARVATMLLLTLRGTPTRYYGDELGMQDVPIPDHLAQDPQGKRQSGFGRDRARTPMQWDDGPNAGFCLPNVEPWLPLAADYQKINAATEHEDARSQLFLTRALLSLRRRTPALTSGSYHTLESGSEHCFVYLREQGEQRLMVALNCSEQGQVVKVPEVGQGRLLLSTYLDREGPVNLAALPLRSQEGCIIEIKEFHTL